MYLSLGERGDCVGRPGARLLPHPLRPLDRLLVQRRHGRVGSAYGKELTWRAVDGGRHEQLLLAVRARWFVTALADRPRVPRQMTVGFRSSSVCIYARRPNNGRPFVCGYSRLAGYKCNLCQTRRVVTDVTATPNTSLQRLLLFLALGFLWGSATCSIKIGGRRSYIFTQSCCAC
jgi:hypothetical protein